MIHPSQRTGDDFSEKYTRYASTLFRIAMAHLGNRDDAEEVMQDAFTRLLYRAPAFRDEEHEKAWIIRVTVNLCKNRLTSGWRKRVVSLEERGECPVASEDARLWEEVVRLPARYKAVIYLHYYEDYKVTKIATMLGISESAAKMRLSRGRELLRMELEGE